ncbi:MAG: hypothetical protein H0Z32_05230 [Bacillaceae bacterium]|nr:hypothetical protein [Bacillaceae bacterium]
MYRWIAVIGILILLGLIHNAEGEAQSEFMTHINRMNTSPFPYIKMTFYSILIGILLEWKSLKSVVNGNIKIDWQIAPAIIVLIVAFIPEYYWISRFPQGTIWQALSTGRIQVFIDVIAGILISRSIAKHEK